MKTLVVLEEKEYNALQEEKRNETRMAIRSERRVSLWRRFSYVSLCIAIISMVFSLAVLSFCKQTERAKRHEPVVIRENSVKCITIPQPKWDKDILYSTMIENRPAAEPKIVTYLEDEYPNNIENCVVTYYCRCSICCKHETGITASGAVAVEGVTVAVDRSVIPLGSAVCVDYVGGDGDSDIREYIAQDTGVKGNHIDVYVSSHEKAVELGRRTATVYWR